MFNYLILCNYLICLFPSFFCFIVLCRLAKPDGSISHFSQQWFDHVGTAAGLTWECFIHPGDLERTQSVWSHSLTTLQPYEIEYRIRGKDGTFQWFLGRANPRCKTTSIT
jgi:hypothetical protein